LDYKLRPWLKPKFLQRSKDLRLRLERSCHHMAATSFAELFVLHRPGDILIVDPRREHHAQMT